MHRGGFGGDRGERSFGGGGRDFEQREAPVKVGEEVEVTIEAVGAKGDGIAKKEGFVIFVPNAAKGDTVRIRITKVLNNMAFAEVAGQAGSGSAPQPRKESRKDEGSEDSSGGESTGNSGSAEPDEQPVDSENFGEEER